MKDDAAAGCGIFVASEARRRQWQGIACAITYTLACCRLSDERGRIAADEACVADYLSPRTTAMSGSRPSICFVAHNAYGALRGENFCHVGGIEIQQATMARWFVDRDYPVRMITWDEGYPDGMILAGVRLHKLCTRRAGMKGLRFFHPRWTSLVRAMKKVDADIYYYNCGDLGLGQVVLWAHRHGRKVLYSVACDPVCDPALTALANLRERALYRYGLSHVDHIVVQTHRQQQMLRAGFGLASTRIPMPSLGFDVGTAPTGGYRAGNKVLWVGRFSQEKRLEWLLDAAARCPNLVFDVVGAPNVELEYSARVLARGQALPNVRMHGRVNHEEMGRFYRTASVLCCTSMYEGFPNTFLEAWSVGLPVVSTVDPDGLIVKYGLGRVVGGTEELDVALRDLANFTERWQTASQAAYRYFSGNHTMQSVMPIFESVILKLVVTPR